MSPVCGILTIKFRIKSIIRICKINLFKIRHKPCVAWAVLQMGKLVNLKKIYGKLKILPGLILNNNESKRPCGERVNNKATLSGSLKFLAKEIFFCI